LKSFIKIVLNVSKKTEIDRLGVLESSQERESPSNARDISHLTRLSKSTEKFPNKTSH